MCKFCDMIEGKNYTELAKWIKDKENPESKANLLEFFQVLASNCEASMPGLGFLLFHALLVKIREDSGINEKDFDLALVGVKHDLQLLTTTAIHSDTSIN